MAAQQESPAIAIARAHVEAWSNHDFDTARTLLAPDVRVTATATQPRQPATALTGADDYMAGLTRFAQAVVPGSLRILASAGDERNALLMLTVEVKFGAGKATLAGARLYLLDDNDKIKTEHVIYYIAQD
ncbi:MAG TPA: nuclear transport factor 2 family protein [Actinomycetes bacterium]